MKIRNVVKIIGHCVAAKDYEVAEAFLQSYIDKSFIDAYGSGVALKDTDFMEKLVSNIKEVKDCYTCLDEKTDSKNEPCKSCRLGLLQNFSNWSPKK